MYTLTLHDGKVITGLDKNGDNFVSKEQIDESIFEENLETLTISDGETTTVMHNAVLIQQMEWVDGTFYLAFRELTPEELTAIALNGKLEYIAMMADIDLEEV